VGNPVLYFGVALHNLTQLSRYRLLYAETYFTQQLLLYSYVIFFAKD